MKLFNLHLKFWYENVVMKLFLTVLILILSLQSWTKADDISDFEIEGISIGDSLLDYVDQEFIKKTKSYLHNNNKFYTILLEEKYQTFDAIQLTILDEDTKYIIRSLTGKIFYDNENINECYELLDSVSSEVSNILKEVIIDKIKTKKIPHTADRTGNSTTKGTFFRLNKGDSVYVYCTDWSDEMEYADNLKVQIRTKSYSDWLSNEAYN